MFSNPSVIVNKNNHITVITIDRQRYANAIDSATSHKLSDAFDDFANDSDQWVAILTGAGQKYFCSGMDLNERNAAGRRPQPVMGFGGLTKRFGLHKPVIASVNGAAVGGGFELALACDFIIASEHAIFALPEVKRGLAALGGGIQRLARALGHRRALEVLLTGKQIKASEAEHLGLANRVVPAKDLEKETRSFAEKILTAAPLAVRATKETLMRGLDEPSLMDTLAGQDMYPSVADMRNSEDAKEGPLAFIEKRKPVWRGL